LGGLNVTDALSGRQENPVPGEPLLRVRGLTRIYGRGCTECVARTGPEAGNNICPVCASIVACAEVSFDLYSGEILGVVGESGSG